MSSLPTELESKVSQNSQRTLQQRVIVAEYGDGNSQTAAIGINSRYDEWDLQFNVLNKTLRDSFMTFYAEVGMVKTWTWTPPDGVLGKYRITEAPVETNNGLVYNISMKVKQVY